MRKSFLGKGQKHWGMIAFFAVIILLSACSKKETPQNTRNDFESLMGKDLPAWSNVKTAEDFDNLKFFKTLYEKNLSFLSAPSLKARIPKVIHFIWIGPKSFPRESVDNVRSWVAKHPDWKVKFWTDRERPLPHPAMEKVLLKDFTFLKLADCYHKSDNFGEKSDILRYEILFQEGGIYVDHDVKCLQSFEEYNGAFDLYCGLEMPYKTSLSSSVLPTNNIIASKPGHPVLRNCLEWLTEKWDQIERDYPGKDRDAVINRVSHRTFLVLGESIKAFGNRSENRDMVFPAFYFNAPADNLAIASRHLYAGMWFENESPFEKMARERLMMLSKKTNKILLFFGVMSALNIGGFIAIALLLRSRRKAAP